MREIKFRFTWKIEDGEIYNYELPISDFWSHGVSNTKYKRNRKGLAAKLIGRDQWAGIVDSEGAEIYEGDIVNLTHWHFDGGEVEMHLIGMVVYMPECASFGLGNVSNADWLRYVGLPESGTDTVSFGSMRFAPDDLEILGNIHQNPELLESV